jgi:hypothetical protein
MPERTDLGTTEPSGEVVDQLGITLVLRLCSEHPQRDVFGSPASARGESAFEQGGHGSLGLADVLSGEQCSISRGRFPAKWLLQQGLQGTGLVGRSRRPAR